MAEDPKPRSWERVMELRQHARPPGGGKERTGRMCNDDWCVAACIYRGPPVFLCGKKVFSREQMFPTLRPSGCPSCRWEFLDINLTKDSSPQSRQSAKLFSSRRTSPTPHPQASVPPPASPPPGSASGGKGTLAGERGGGGRVPISARGHTLWYSIYVCTLCSSVLLYSIHSPFFWRILKKIMIFYGFKTPYKKNSQNKETRFMNIIL